MWIVFVTTPTPNATNNNNNKLQLLRKIIN